MRWSKYYLETTRDNPADAEVVSHRLMVRSAMLKKHASGIYSYQPSGWRSLRKLMAIVRRELDAIGALELSMPAVQPAELWQESGRWQAYGKELLRIRDRHEREFCFGPTHEELVTDLVRRDVKSYRQLPLNLYQIQTKFRDEIRPRFGLMRGREFLMKDAYSFHVDAECLERTYREMHDAYSRIIAACGLEFVVVEADSGAIGGSRSHEFMVIADTGESALLGCSSCGYGANVEKASSPLVSSCRRPADRLEELPTPGMTSIAAVAAHLGVSARDLVKTLIYRADGASVAVVMRGDRAVNEVKLKNFLVAQDMALASDDEVRATTGARVGFAGPIGLAGGVRLLADESVRDMDGFIAGGNRDDLHFGGVRWGRDARPEAFVDLLVVEGGDPCPRCGSGLAASRGIEVGHIFQLGTKYSESMGCTFADAEGAERPMVMGCYGLGIGRTLAAAIEQNHDDDGIIWPQALAPFEVLLLLLNTNDPKVVAVSETLYAGLRAAGVDVLYDDRDQRPGVKFKDADLIGVPWRVVVGAKALAGGEVELSARRDRERELVPVDAAIARVEERLAASSQTSS